MNSEDIPLPNKGYRANEEEQQPLPNRNYRDQLEE